MTLGPSRGISRQGKGGIAGDSEPLRGLRPDSESVTEKDSLRIRAKKGITPERNSQALSWLTLAPAQSVPAVEAAQAKLAASGKNESLQVQYLQ
ncbi:hypothetical protein Xmau_03800 [Xenorhabdus mauleonii]|uniref:Uncharacterized protein n=1 Tax=Xenorhabdus mauleonii TaxID=351675 RepID=A0A1I3V0D1_9GAMM|nr:hypothetical protein [Xenorhabdus mauleonii]PHM37583.1 hypothetical protein Xmau_03800 [Xenorhabdus mauleonii]SFJ88888.1 hypothetical protein SAMN05421680_1195 [Xenorhabdus mauleonii]